MASRTGAGRAVEALRTAGVRHLFTVSGNHVLSIYDATIGRGIELVHTRHEASAVHMADAWGRLTGEPGVALVTGGPGHANALSALYGARLAESPVLLLSGHCPLAEIGRGGFQEMDQVALARPVTKAAWCATEPGRLDREVEAALELASAWPPGPVHLSLPSDVLEASVPAPPRLPAAREPVSPTAALARARAEASARDEATEEMDQALRVAALAKRPLIIVGPAAARGARWAAVTRLAEVTGIPVLRSESPRGVNDPWLRAATRCLAQADLVLLVGKRLDFSLRFGEPPAFFPGCRFVLVGTEPERDGAAAARGPGIPGEPGIIVARLGDLARQMRWAVGGWRAEVEAARAAAPPEWADLRRAGRAPAHPLRVCQAIQPYLDRSGVFVSDGGEFGQWAQAALEAETRLINGPSGSIGSAIPMALAARLRHPDRPVCVTVGDGTFGYAAAEFDTALRYRLPILCVVGNDARWNAEYQLQLKHYDGRAVGCELLPSRYDRVVEGLGGHGEFVERPEQLEGALARAVASGLPACVNALIEPAAAPTFGPAPRARA